jgi:hypothetical protein
MIFPTVTGSNLLRQRLTLPQDLQGRYNLLFIAFEQWQQLEVNSWIPLVRKLEEQYRDLAYYELPTIQKRISLYQKFINEGMRAGIPNPKTRERTITLYLDKREFRTNLGITDEDHIYVLLIDHQGNELYRTRGQYSLEAEESICQVLDHLT